MTISDAQFSAWLAADNPRVVLWEQKFAYESGGAPVEGTLYFASRTYRTGAGDSPANQAYRGRIRAAPRLERSINPDGLGGITGISITDVALDNLDGALDPLLRNIIDGREGTWLIGAPEGTPGWSRSDFRTVAVTLAEVASAPDDKRINVALRDKRLLLDKAIAGDVVSDERRKPLVFCSGSGTTVGGPGQAYNIPLVLKDSATLEYWALQNYNSDASVPAVYDNALLISIDINSTALFSATNAAFTADAGTETLTKVGHGLAVNDVILFENPGPGSPRIFAGLSRSVEYWVIAAGLTADNFRLSLTKGGSAIDITGTTFSDTVSCYRGRAYTGAVKTAGTVQLSSSAAGLVTGDVIGVSASQALSTSTPGRLVRALLIDYGGIASGDIDASLSAADSSISLGYQRMGRAVLDRENLLDVIDEVALVTQVWWGPDHLGDIYGGRLDLSALSGATAAHELGANRIQDLRIENGRIIRGTIALRTQRNMRPLTFGEFAGAVGDSDRRKFSAQYRLMRENTAPTGTAYSTNWQGFFKTAVRAEFAGAFATDGADISSMADEILGDLKPHIQIIDVETDLRAYEWRLGDVVNLTYPRYSFANGQKCRLIGSTVDLVAERVSLRLITQTTPDYTTASYN